LAARLADALGYAHARGILHRDVKPANVMLDAQDQPILVDFGLARQSMSAAQTLTQTGAVLGTPAYLAPEQLGEKAAQAGYASDLYSLGVTLYHLLTGAVPFTGPVQSVMVQVLFHPPTPLRRHRPELDPALEAICLKAMAKEPAERHASGQAFARALEGWLAGQTPPVGAAAVVSEPTPLDVLPVVDRPPVLHGPTEPLLPKALLAEPRGHRDQPEEGTTPATLDTVTRTEP